MSGLTGKHPSLYKRIDGIDHLQEKDRGLTER